MLIGLLVVVGAVAAVFLTSLFKTVEMSTKVKTLISLVASTAMAVLVAIVGNGGNLDGFDKVSPLILAATLYGTQQAIYNFILKGTALDAKLEDSFVASDTEGNSVGE